MTMRRAPGRAAPGQSGGRKSSSIASESPSVKLSGPARSRCKSRFSARWSATASSVSGISRRAKKIPESPIDAALLASTGLRADFASMPGKLTIPTRISPSRSRIVSTNARAARTCAVSGSVAEGFEGTLSFDSLAIGISVASRGFAADVSIAITMSYSAPVSPPIQTLPSISTFPSASKIVSPDVGVET